MEEDEERTEEAPYDEVDKLESVGIAASDIAKLKSAGIFTVGGIKMQTKKVC